MCTSSKTFQFNVNSLVFLKDLCFTGALKSQQTTFVFAFTRYKYFSLFHIIYFQLQCTKVESCSLWPNKEWKFARLGKKTSKMLASGHWEELEDYCHEGEVREQRSPKLSLCMPRGTLACINDFLEKKEYVCQCIKYICLNCLNEEPELQEYVLDL